MEKYLSRLVESEISTLLRLRGGVFIQGPKWCGKSTTAERFAKTVVKLQDKKVLREYQTYAANSSENLFEGERPILFDEWQKIPELWDYIRNEVDQSRDKGGFLLTGSAAAKEDPNRHSGIGRISRLTMRPMSLWESGESTGQVSLKDLFGGADKISGNAKIKLDDIAYLVCRGGFPDSVLSKGDDALKVSKLYHTELVEHDITNVDEISRNPDRARRILRSYARNISSLATNATIKEDVIANDSTMDEKTLASYTNAFRKLFIIEDVPAWCPRLRSKTFTRTSDKRQFVDPSLAAVALGVTQKSIMKDMNTFGFLFESLCTRDLRIYADMIGGRVSHFRDATGLEADAVIHLENDDWAAIEIKLGGQQIDEAASNLLKMVEKIEIAQKNSPKFLMVLTGLDYAYRRSDGVFVVPIGCLKP